MLYNADSFVRDFDFAFAEKRADNLLERLFGHAEFATDGLGIGVVAVGEESACFFELLQNGVRAFALHHALIADWRQVERNLSVAGETLDESGHRVADVDAFHAGLHHEAARVAVIDEAIDVVGRDFVSGEFDTLADVQVVRVRVDEALDFFGGDDASALFIFEHKDDAAVAFLQFAELLLEGEEQVFVQAPVQECSDAVHFLDCEHCEFAHLRERLVESRDGAVFGVRINEHVDDFAFDEREFVAIAGEEYASASFKFQVVALRRDGFDASAVDSSKFHNLPFRSGVPRGGVKPRSIAVVLSFRIRPSSF